jgi:N-methylhydantoinase A
MGYSLGIDTGGTHTDLILIDKEKGSVWTVKVPTTPNEPLQGILRGIDRLLADSGSEISHLDELVYGTTLVTNMVVQHQSVAPTVRTISTTFRWSCPRPLSAGICAWK